VTSGLVASGCGRLTANDLLFLIRGEGTSVNEIQSQRERHDYAERQAPVQGRAGGPWDDRRQSPSIEDVNARLEAFLAEWAESPL
jgi:hypothetical protein